MKAGDDYKDYITNCCNAPWVGIFTGLGRRYMRYPTFDAVLQLLSITFVFGCCCGVFRAVDGDNSHRWCLFNLGGVGSAFSVTSGSLLLLPDIL